MDIIIIAAVAENGVIGKGNEIPWYIPEDFKLFKRFTSGNVVLMGSKTYASIGKALPNRHNIVISRKIKSLDDAVVADSYEGGLEKAKAYAAENNCDVYIIGGASIYELGIKDANQICLSHVKGTYDGDTYFPKYDGWVETEKQEFEDFTFKRYERRK
jgi:dihydrofolate reductase